MRKVLVIFISSIILLVLGGCSSLGTGPVDTVKEMYTAAINNDLDSFSKIMSQAEDIDGHEREAMEELASTAFDQGGVKKMKFAEVKKENLLKEAKDGITEQYGDNWSVVAQEIGADQSEVMVWLLKKVDGDYYVLYADDMSPDEFLKKR